MAVIFPPATDSHTPLIQKYPNGAVSRVRAEIGAPGGGDGAAFCMP